MIKSLAIASAALALTASTAHGEPIRSAMSCSSTAPSPTAAAGAASTTR
jgi:hypothetical protein